MKNYDVTIVGAGPGGIYSAYELSKLAPQLKVAIIEYGNPLEKRKCPIDGEKITKCINCKTCAIMNGFGGAGAFSDGKYNITNDFGGTLFEHVGKKKALEYIIADLKCSLAHHRMGLQTTLQRIAEDERLLALFEKKLP